MRRKIKSWNKRLLCITLSLLILYTGLPQYTALAAENYEVTTIAGIQSPGFGGDEGPANLASLNAPNGVAIDNQGNLYIADTLNSRVRKVSAEGIITTVAGNGNPGYAGDGGSAKAAELNDPRGIVLDSQGNLYIADSKNYVVRKVTADGVISTIAGIAGSFGHSGDGGPAVEAMLKQPFGVAVDSQDNLYIADIQDQVIRKVTTDGIISTVAGQSGVVGYSGDGGAAIDAQFHNPTGVALDNQNNLYIADMDNNVVRKVTEDGVINTIAGQFGTNGYGGDEGPATKALLRGPADVALDNYGNLYIIEYFNNVLRKVTPEGIISTVVGNFPVLNAEFNYPFGLAIDNNGVFYVADTANSKIKKINTVTYAAALSQEGEYVFPKLLWGYNTGEIESKTITVTNTGSGTLKNLKITISGSGAGSFELGRLTRTTLDNTNTTAVFTVQAREWLALGTHTATITVSADKMQDISFTVTQTIEEEITDAQTPQIIRQPQEVTVEEGKDVNFEVAATVEKGNLSYQWYRNTTNSNTGGTIISGAVQSSYRAPADELKDSWYYCVITNLDTEATGSKTASVTSNAAKAVTQSVTNAETPGILKHPKDVTVQKGEEAILEVTAAVSSGSLTYQWYSNAEDSTEGGTPIEGAVQDSYGAPTDTEGKKWYYCVVTNTDPGVNGNKTAAVTTSTASVTVISKTESAEYTVTVIGGSGGGSYPENSDVSITANPAPAGKVFYRWTSSRNIAFQNPEAESTVFTMPAGEVTITAEYRNTPTVTPALPSTPDEDGDIGNQDKTEEKTIKVVEAPKGIPNTAIISVEEVGKAFDKSVEVRLKEDSAAEREVRKALETDTIGLNMETMQIFPLDISLYIKGTNTKVQPAQGTSVRITCPIPTSLLPEKEKLLVVTVTNEKLQVLPAELTVKEGVSCLQFEAAHFSPYAFVVDSDGRLAEGAQIITDITVTEGTLTEIRPENLPAGAEVKYHVSTPTFISIDQEGKLFAKKAGSAYYMTAVTYGGNTKVYTVKVKVMKAQGATKVGFIRYSAETFAYKDINYRITSKASGTGAGEVAIANNQMNSKLPGKVVIPETIDWKGKKYKVTSIDESAFYGRSNITSVTIPANIKVISPTAFTSCNRLKEFKVDRENKQYSAKGAMLLNKQGTVLLAYPSASGTIVIDRKITEIGSYAFSVCKELKAVVIPETVKSIGGCAFAHSSKLEKVVFQSSQVPEMTYYSVFEKVKDTCVFQVPASSGELYVQAMQELWLPKDIVIKQK
ncbi:leucine-rich repeat protein [Anaerocolumna sp. AGMB13020]|uniref:NHL domain-containing protein n=1 Tax=Anaerocolumna sp. AGMB13020 TaxID=3081750 RepID=UPI0029533EEE|nr:leucine-rich repeat protein [Anaerocolumna sp. AGMB13020]WOO34722.1 leucine-rich repeat protein [Anaerocolumna sp. AGMB13020]